MKALFLALAILCSAAPAVASTFSHEATRPGAWQFCTVLDRLGFRFEARAYHRNPRFARNAACRKALEVCGQHSAAPRSCRVF